MGFSDRQKQAGIRLELTWFEARQCWKKKHKDKIKYLKHPNTKAGYEEALKEWFEFKNDQFGKLKYSILIDHYKALFTKIQKWYDAFGTPAAETKLSDQVSAFLIWLEELRQLRVQERITDSHLLPMGEFCLIGKRNEFWEEFVNNGSGYSLCGLIEYELPSKWIDRIDRAGNQNLSKEPQTIDYWIKKYLSRTRERAERANRKKPSKDRKYKLATFSKSCDKLAHITTIDSEYVEKFHIQLDDGNHEKSTKEGYFAAFRMFVRWCSRQKKCDLILPANLDSKEFSFREPKGTGRKRQEKKLLLWTPDEFNTTIDKLPAPYPCFLILMLNCGFRHVDLGELRKSDYHEGDGRIVIQRHKLNQQATTPVISYKLWDKTVELLKAAMSSEDEFMFRNQTGGSVENSIKLFWKRNKNSVGGKRLDYLRKTGSTSVARFDRFGQLDGMYLGEALDTTAKIHYSFIDGEPCQALDDAIQNLGAEFGFCDPPFKRVQLTPEVLKKLQKAGVDVEKL